MPLGIRPTQNLVRKAVFDLLGQDLDGLEFLDLFAGSGAMGLEAYSRGAKRVALVEKERVCSQAIEQNLRLLGFDPSLYESSPMQLFTSDVFVAIRQFGRFKRKFDVIFLDPPYIDELAKKTLKTLGGCDILHPNCFLVIQHEKREILPQEEGPLKLYTQRNYGATNISIYRLNSKL